MVHFCCVPGCGNRSDRDCNFTYHRLPLKKKGILKQWIHKIGRKELPLNESTRICSRHFVNSKGHMLRPDEVSTLNLPTLATQVVVPSPRRPLVRHPVQGRTIETHIVTEPAESPVPTCNDVGVNTDLTMVMLDSMEEELKKVKRKLIQVEKDCDELEEKQVLRLSNIKDDEDKVKFYTGFSTMSALMVCFNFLGPSVNMLNYWHGSTQETQVKITRSRRRKLPPIEEFFLVLIRLHLGSFEQDLGYRFGISQTTVSCIIVTWINFMYLQFKQIPLWPPRALTLSNMPKLFKDKYPMTRVIIDATEIFVEQPHLTELQQLTFSNYKNHNTYKGLVGISPSGSVIFISDLFPGSISDKELTRRSGLLNLLESGDSIMADRGFDIQEDLNLLGVKLNIPPFLKGKPQLNPKELVETRRIASLRIHVERAMEQIKNYHIFDKPFPSSLCDTANQFFFVCTVLTNFNPPLCNNK